MNLSGWLKARLSRVTSSGVVIPELDGIRFLALSAVLMHHVLAWYLIQTERFGKVHLPRDWKILVPRDWFISLNLHLYFAIPVFFALSGFIVTLPFARRYRAGLPPPSIRSFYLRRVVRMEPPYVLSCLICFLAIVLPFHHGDTSAYFKAFFPHLAASVVYLHGTVFGEPSWINGVAWTLEVDVQFYLLVPLLAMLFRLRSRMTRQLIILVLILGFSALSQFVIAPSANTRLQLSLVNYIQFFLVGFILVDLYPDQRERSASRSFRADAICLLSAVIIFIVIHRLPGLAWYLPFCLVPLYAGALGGRITSAFLRSPLLAIPGAMCYTVFLYHELVIRALEPYGAPLSPASWPLWADFAVQAAILMPAIFAFSVVLFLIAEKPFMVLSRDLARKQRLRAEETSAAA